MNRPLLLLDVDGVLALRSANAPGYTEHTVVSTTGDRHELWFNDRHGDWLRLLSEVFEVVWSTGWEHKRHVQHAPGLPLRIARSHQPTECIRPVSSRREHERLETALP